MWMQNVNKAKILSVNYGAYNAIRMLIGVYHAAFLISTGISISELAFLQVIFSVTILLLDFPLSVVADRFYRKQMVVLGVFFTILFYPLCMLSPNIIALILSEVFYAIGICCISGAIEGWVLGELKTRRNEFSIYAHLCERVSSLGSVITGVIGITAVFIFSSYKTGYIISIIMMIVVFVVFILVSDSKINLDEKRERDSLISHTKESYNIIFNQADGRFFLTISCLFTFGVQIIYHFWQPIMLSGEKIGNISTNEMIILLLCHVGAFSAQYLTNLLLPKFDIKGKGYISLAIFFSIFSSLCSVVLMGLLSNQLNMISILVYSILHGMMASIPISAQNIFVSKLKAADDLYISGTLGLVSFSCRVSSIIVLGGIALLSENIPVYFYMLIPTFAYVFCGIVFFKWSLNKKDVNYHEQIE